MRAFFDRHTWITYLVVGLFLLATSGTAISRMTCLEGGHSILSLGITTGCCPEEEGLSDVPEFRPACCELAFVQGERDNYLPNVGFDFFVEEIDLWHMVVDISLPHRMPVISWLGSRPPPLSGPDRLAAISVQRV